jgi:hypothetical protein
MNQTDVADLAVIAQLPALQELHISQTQVSDLGVLADRPSKHGWRATSQSSRCPSTSNVSPLLAMPWEDLKLCVRVNLVDNPLSSPDTATVVEQLCATQMIDFDAGPELRCTNPDCPR